LRALSEVTVVLKKMAKSEQKMVKTHSPGPKTTNAIMKWAESRKYKAVVWKAATSDRNEEVKSALEVAEKAKTMVAVKDQEKKIDHEESDTVIIIDTNPELLNDASFDANLDWDHQSSKDSQTGRFNELFDAYHTGSRIAPCPAYGSGESFTLGRKMPKVIEVKLESYIPCLPESTLNYGGKYLLIACVMTGRGPIGVSEQA
jgi:hypothetical protein